MLGSRLDGQQDSIVHALPTADTLAGGGPGKPQSISYSTNTELKTWGSSGQRSRHAGCYKPDLGLDAMYLFYHGINKNY